MIDPFVILAPILLLAVIALLQFIGCDQLFGLPEVLDLTAVPSFNPPEGTYSGPILVELSDTTPGATIYYTLDDTDPSSSPGGSTQQYDPASPIPVSSQTTISAIASSPNHSNSGVGKATYNFGPIVFHQYKDGLLPAGSVGDTVATPGFDNPVSPGSLIVVWIWYNTAGQSVQVDMVSDSDMNMNYSRAVGPTPGTGTLAGYQQEIWYGIVASGGPNFTVAAKFSGVFNGEKAITGHEFTGADQTSPLIQPGAFNSGSTAMANCGPLPATSNGLVFAAAVFQVGGPVPGTGFMQMSSQKGNVSEYQNPAASGPVTATFSNLAQSWIAQMATFK